MHFPVRPQWSCAGCGGRWPCETRRTQLAAEFSGARVSLALYLASCMVEAAYDLPHHSAGALYARFLGWARG
jgi:predicted metal-binding protein